MLFPFPFPFSHFRNANNPKGSLPSKRKSHQSGPIETVPGDTDSSLAIIGLESVSTGTVAIGALRWLFLFLGMPFGPPPPPPLTAVAALAWYDC
jgi:hypothetical protein